MRFALALLLALAAPSVAFADSPREQARTAYDAGSTEYNLGNYDKALVEFQRAYRLIHDAAFLYNIAQCQRQLGQYEDAQRSYRAYLREGTDIDQKQREDVQRLIASMDLAIKEKRAQQPPTGTRPPSGATMPTSGEPTTAAPAAAPAAAIVVAPPPARPSPALRNTGIGLLAGGGLCLVLGGVFVGLAKSANDDAGAGGVYHPDAIARRNGYQSADAAMFTIGGVAVATGTVLFILGRRGVRK